jgi:hypothetical protein
LDSSDSSYDIESASIAHETELRDLHEAVSRYAHAEVLIFGVSRELGASRAAQSITLGDSRHGSGVWPTTATT